MPVPGVPRGATMMTEDSLEAVFSMVEKAFLRLQAGDIVVSCLEQNDASPILRYVESLVVEGPKSLSALREIRIEVSTRRYQFQEEITNTFLQLEQRLLIYGINLAGLADRHLLNRMEPTGFQVFLNHQGIEDEVHQRECMRLVHNAKETMSALARQILLLEDIELYLEDWIWGLIYQSARQMIVDSFVPGKKPRYAL
jgi:hypothetical protein